MEIYKNISGSSGVARYELRASSIVVEFRGSGRLYEWSYASAGRAAVERMKTLAKAGSGLNSYIQTSVRKDYVR